MKKSQRVKAAPAPWWRALSVTTFWAALRDMETVEEVAAAACEVLDYGRTIDPRHGQRRTWARIALNEIADTLQQRFADDKGDLAGFRIFATLRDAVATVEGAAACRARIVAATPAAERWLREREELLSEISGPD